MNNHDESIKKFIQQKRDLSSLIRKKFNKPKQQTVSINQKKSSDKKSQLKQKIDKDVDRIEKYINRITKKSSDKFIKPESFLKQQQKVDNSVVKIEKYTEKINHITRKSLIKSPDRKSQLKEFKHKISQERKKIKKQSILVENTQLYCPLKNKITDEIYNYKDYKGGYINIDQVETIKLFMKFLKDYYKCICVSEPQKHIDEYTIYLNNGNTEVSEPFDVTLNKQANPGIALSFPTYNTFVVYDKHKVVTLFTSHSLLSLIKGCKLRYLTINIGMTEEKNGHANALIIDIKNKTMIRFEPHFHNDPTLVDGAFEKFAKTLKYTYIPPVSFCPGISGPQQHEKNSQDNEHGFCLAFSLLFICYKLDYPTLEYSKLVDLMYRGKNKKETKKQTPKMYAKNVSNEIRYFANFLMKKTKK